MGVPTGPLTRVSKTGTINARSVGDMVEVYCNAQGRTVFTIKLKEEFAIDLATALMVAAGRKDTTPRFMDDDQ